MSVRTTLDSLLLYNVFVPKKRVLNTNKNIAFSCQYHVIWCPKYRRKVLVGEVKDRLVEIIYEVASDLQADVTELQVMPDHVHLLIDCDPSFGVYKVIKRIKGTSSRLLRREFPTLRSRLPTLWTNSMCILSTGGASIATIRRYIQDQKDV